MRTFVLHDTRYDTYISRGDNFNRQWMSHIQSHTTVKFAHPSMKDFKDGDTIIVYLDNKNPFGTYNLDKKLRKIFIVGELTSDNINYLHDADHVVYLNELQEFVANKYGIKTKKTTCPHHPFPDTNINIKKKKEVFIGGLFNTKIAKLDEKILKLHRNMPEEYIFNIIFVGSGVYFNSFKETLTNWLYQSDLNKSRIVKIDFNREYINTFNLLIASSDTVYLHKTEINATKQHNHDEMLKNGVRDSSILSLTKKYNNNIICEDSLCYYNYFNKTEYSLSFKGFSDLIKGIL